MALPSGTLWASTPEEGYYNWNDAVETFGVNMPTKWQWQELLESCSKEIIGKDKDTLLLKGKNGNVLLIPKKGNTLKNSNVHNKTTGYYWTANNYDKLNATYVILEGANVHTIPITYKTSYYMSILLVNK